MEIMIAAAIIVGSSVALVLTVMICNELEERRCRSKGGRGRDCQRPFLCRRVGRHIAEVPPDKMPEIPRWTEGA